MQRVAPSYPASFSGQSSLSGCGETVGKGSTFPRTSRLSDSADFDGVFKGSKRSVDDYFTVLYKPNDSGRSRLGLAIAKKRVRRAVARNRLKRIIRESFRVSESKLNGFDIVIMARQKAEAATNQELFLSLDRHWESLGKAIQRG